MASTVNGGEGEFTLTLFDVTSNLTLDHVRSPGGGNVPVKFVDPTLSTVGRNGTIGITGELEHSVFALELLVDPLGTFSTTGVVDVIFAEIPRLDAIRDVKGVSNLAAVKVVNDGVTESARRKTSKSVFFLGGSSKSPRSVVSGSERLLVRVELRSITKTPAGTIDIVNVNVRDELLEFKEVSQASSSEVLHSNTTEIAVVLMDLVVELGIVERVPVGHLNVGSASIVVPVGNTITDHETLEVRLEDIGVVSVGFVVLIDLVGDVRHVDTGVRLTRNVKIVLLVLTEFLVPSKDGSQVIGGRKLISENALGLVGALRVTNTSRRFDVEHVSFLVPGVVVLMEVVITTLHNERTMLLSETEHG
mmetsp:Transcript_63889/g.88219  ORF Transcript_63889/g.88219 Transcript_63889/m.88219 type:complete len:362 (+) Transcript_63889:159-1244(+)